MTEVKRESPLVDIANRELSFADISIQEKAFLGHFNLRGDPGNSAFATAVFEVIKLPIPMQPSTMSSNEQASILWLGPDEWLIVTDSDKSGDDLQILRGSLSAQFSALTDISSGQTVLKVSGTNARRLLSKGTTLDLHPASFKIGQCAQTVMAKCGVTLYLENESDPAYHVLVRRSFADYLWHWLEDACVEFGSAA